LIWKREKVGEESGKKSGGAELPHGDEKEEREGKREKGECAPNTGSSRADQSAS